MFKPHNTLLSLWNSFKYNKTWEKSFTFTNIFTVFVSLLYVKNLYKDIIPKQFPSVFPAFYIFASSELFQWCFSEIIIFLFKTKTLFVGYKILGWVFVGTCSERWGDVLSRHQGHALSKHHMSLWSYGRSLVVCLFPDSSRRQSNWLNLQGLLWGNISIPLYKD